MTIYSALYYPGSLARGDLIVRDNRLYVGKYLETLPVWMAYIRRHYPDEKLVLFADAASPLPWRDAAKLLGEPYTYETTVGECSEGGGVNPSKIHIIVLTQFAGQYFRAMQRNLVEAMIDAYNRDGDLMWIDNDCFANTCVAPLVAGYDFAAPQIAHHQMTADSVFTYISAARLHAYDRFCRLPDYLRNMLDNGPTETRMHSLQEGGLYKLFAFGKARELGPHIDLAHLSCYDHFMTFLRANPLNTPEYRALVGGLEKLVKKAKADGRLDRVDMVFQDMLYLTKGGGK